MDKMVIHKMVNGYTITHQYPNSEGTGTWVFEYDEYNEDEVDALLKLVQHIVDMEKPYNKWDKKNIIAKIRTKFLEFLWFRDKAKYVELNIEAGHSLVEQEEVVEEDEEDPK